MMGNQRSKNCVIRLGIITPRSRPKTELRLYDKNWIDPFFFSDLLVRKRGPRVNPIVIILKWLAKSLEMQTRGMSNGIYPVGNKLLLDRKFSRNWKVT